MTFKTKDELFDEKYGTVTYHNSDQLTITQAESYNEGLEDAFKSFTERVEFYKKYKVIPNGKDTTGVNLFRKDYPEIYAKADFSKLSWWNNWLFDYCFKDLLEWIGHSLLSWAGL